VLIDGFNDVMLDLETLDTKPGAVLLSIGAVYFNAELQVLGPTFHEIISRDSCRGYGLTESKDTIEWWNKQKPEALGTLFKACDPSYVNPLTDVLVRFSEFIGAAEKPQKVKVWGNGSDFDNVLLDAAYRAVNMETPWSNYNGRCYRTLKNLRRDIKLSRSGVYHNALDDAISQAEHAVELLNALKTKA